MNKKIEVYSNGICTCSVCACKNLKIKEITNQLNIINPTGISSKWKLSKDKFFKAGETNPCVCEENPNRKHYLFNC